MKTLLSIILFITLSISCFSQTQIEMTIESDQSYKQADKELNILYQKILKTYSTDTLFIQNLKKSQRLWIQFRDAEVAVKYPVVEGSVYSMCIASYLELLTRQRIATLKQWTEGVEEGDACGGSVKIK